MIFGILAMMAFNLVDTFFIGRLGTIQLAAISFTFPVIMIVSSLAMGLGVGASAVISRAIGQGDHDKVVRLTTDSLFLALVIVIVFITAGLILLEPIFRLIGVTADIMPYVKQYMNIWLPGMIFLVIPMVGNNAIRATGDTLTPSLIMIFAVTINAVLDPLLIFGIGFFPRLGLAGAAIATVTARALTMVLSLYILYHREKMIALCIPKITSLIASWKQILFIGIPAAATNMITPVAMGIITRIIAQFGAPAVAGAGVATRVEAFGHIVIMALYTALGPFVGQNWGANKFGRVQKAVRLSQRFGLLWGLGLTTLLMVFGNSIAALFNNDPKFIRVATDYFRILPVGYPLGSVLIISTGVLNVLHKPYHSAFLTVMRTLLLFVPLAYIGSKVIGIEGIFIAGAAAHIISGSAAYFWLKRIMNIESRKQGTNTGITI